MGLFVSTTGTDVTIQELGVVIVHPTTDRDMGAQFSAEEIVRAVTLTSTIQAGTLVWRKVAAGAVQAAADYDPEFVEAEQEATGPGLYIDRGLRLRELWTPTVQATAASTITLSDGPSFTPRRL